MMGKDVVKALIIDDSATVRKRLIAMPSETVKAESVGCAEDATEAANSRKKLNADAVMPDIGMPRGSQMNVPLKTESNNQTLPVIALADYAYRQYHGKYVDVVAGFFFDKLTQFDGLMAVLGPLHQIRRL